MRISTLTLFDQSVSAMNRQQSDFLKVSQQIASGKRILTPSDDPQAATKALGVAQSKAVAEQYADGRISARNSLSNQESVLSRVTDALERTKALVVQAANGTLNGADRASVASELRGVMETVFGLANSTDGDGRFLFGGFQDNSSPFVKDGLGNVSYTGDSNNRQIRVDGARLMEVSDSGDDIFLSVPAGSGYLAEADTGNTGTATFVGPSVVDTSAPDFGAGFSLNFAVDGTGQTTYSVNGGPPEAYVEGNGVEFGGLTMTFEGQPADGDSFRVDKAENMNTSLFATFEKVIAALETPVETEVDDAALANTLRTSMREFDNSRDNILTLQASAGARLNELDALDLVGENRVLSYQQTLSDLVDLDYNEAVADYSLRQVGLQAAQKAFVNINQLSLFELL